jgi:hypothetical protein
MSTHLFSKLGVPYRVGIALSNRHLISYGQKKSKNHQLLLFIGGQAHILVCLICQKLAYCA